MNWDTVISICIGIGLSTACGLRVFIPLLAVSLMSHFGHMPLSAGFAWMGSTPAVIGFSVAAVVEIAGYYIPWVDHALDTIATPTSMIAGTIVTVAILSNIDPFYKWSLGIIAGGGMAGLMQGTTVVARTASTATTGGIGNPIISTVELVGSVFVTILSLLVPIFLAVVLLVSLFFAIRWLVRWKRKQQQLKVGEMVPAT